MGAPLGGVLAVDERVEFLAVLVGVGDGNLDVVALEVDDGIEGIVGEALGEEVEKSAARDVALSVKVDCEAGVEVGEVLYELLDGLVAVVEGWEDCGVGLEVDECSVGLVGGEDGGCVGEDAVAEAGGLHLSVADGADFKFAGQGVDGLEADAVEADAFLERLCVEFAAGVDL